MTAPSGCVEPECRQERVQGHARGRAARQALALQGVLDVSTGLVPGGLLGRDQGDHPVRVSGQRGMIALHAVVVMPAAIDTGLVQVDPDGLVTYRAVRAAVGAVLPAGAALEPAGVRDR